jgi:NAD(P)-dependent dehydrogenase (short-subunit alcohol dehydrogenase family)
MSHNSWVLVTGGAVRLGREICLAFARAGWHVLCHYRHSEQQAQTLCDELRALGVQAQTVGGELDNQAACQRVFEAARAIAGTQLHGIVHNASLFEPDTGLDFDEAQALAQLQVNLLAPMHFGKWMAALHTNTSHRPKPSLVHVLDQKVFNLNPDYFSYTLSKLALERAVSLQAQALAPHVRVNAVSPGLMFLSGPQTQDNFDRAASANLLREPIAASDVAQSVVFLANNPSLTGTTIRVDNGQHLVPTERDIMFVVDQWMKSS